MEKTYKISETDLNKLLNFLQDVPHRYAQPIETHLSNVLSEVLTAEKDE